MLNWGTLTSYEPAAPPAPRRMESHMENEAETVGIKWGFKRCFI